MRNLQKQRGHADYSFVLWLVVAFVVALIATGTGLIWFSADLIYVPVWGARIVGIALLCYAGFVSLSIKGVI